MGCYPGHADSFLVKVGSGVATLGLPDSPGKHARLFKRVFRERRGWGLQEGDRLARHFKGFWERRGWALQEGDRLARILKGIGREGAGLCKREIGYGAEGVGPSMAAKFPNLNMPKDTCSLAP